MPFRSGIDSSNGTHTPVSLVYLCFSVEFCFSFVFYTEEHAGTVLAGAQHMKLLTVLVNHRAQCFSIYDDGGVGTVYRNAPVAKRGIELLRVDLRQHIANAIDTGALHFAAELADLEILENRI